jgi:hypothetical protein
MTITHDARIGFQIPGRSFLAALTAMPLALVLRARQWHFDAVQKRTIAKLPAHLQRDTGEIDHLPPRAPSFTESSRGSHQDRLQQMWLR